ncbi:MAG TPA: hypothetical protein VG389_25815 [Myxococcota bacterium]|jgi:hypothetical protein|nr:hypothetical protein [Myxococcota bacterium]
MSGFTRSPQLLKGAIIGVDPFNPLASIIVFQYNPDSLVRTITPNIAQSSTSSPGEALRFAGPPGETISLDIEVDATDQLEQAKSPATSMGVHPTLASLEMLLYPKSALVIANEILAPLGITEIIPAEAPLTLFIWGIKRVVPVKVTNLTITEEAFDTSLNPIRAKARVAMKILTYQDLGLLSVGGALFMVHQIIKETMATINGVGSLAAAASFSVSVG